MNRHTGPKALPSGAEARVFLAGYGAAEAAPFRTIYETRDTF